MKLTKTQKISLKVVLLFTIAIFSTFIADYLHSFFGDWYCHGCSYGGEYERFHDARWHWGYRHWLYFMMCFILFVIQAVGVINYAISKN